MAAKDYIFAKGMTNLYLTKRLKKANLMSEDRRVVTDIECMDVAYWYLKKMCKELNTDHIVIRYSDGDELYSMKLLKKEEE